jgi:opacity protein-like surface antigen
MKIDQFIIAAFASLGASAFGGSVEPAPAQAQESYLSGWFVAASFGRIYDIGSSADNAFTGNLDLGEMNMDMYTLQMGRRFNYQQYGLSTALYLEVDYLTGDLDINNLGGFAIPNPIEVDMDIIPVTLNAMVERNLYAGLGCYLSGGMGYGFTDTDALGQSESDGGFYAQVAAGLNYKFNEKFELFGGARWVYLDSLDFGNTTLELDDGFAWEAGLRYNF